MLQLKKIELRRGAKLLFENADLQAHAGQRMGIIGVNGSGKSSLFALILGQLEGDAGQLQINRKDVIAHVAQESPSSTQPALEFVQDGDSGLRELQTNIAELEARDSHDKRLHSLYEQMDNIDGFTAETRAARLLHGLGFTPDVVQKPVNEFSGGWRMRLNLAQALMCRSDILLLDEPTNHLDLPTIVWLERWLRSYPGILLLISHDRDFLDGLCTHIAHIEHQAIKSYSGNYSQFEAVRAEQLALQQVMYTKQQKEIKHMQGFVDRFRYKATKAKQAQSRLKMLERMVLIAPAHVDSNFHFKFHQPDKQPQQLVQLEDATVGYGQTAVITGIRLRLSAGDRIGLLGSNGAGKSTLVKTLVDGSTLLSGERTVNKHTHIGYFAQQQLELLRMDCSPLWHVQRQAPDTREQELRNHLGRFGFQGDRITDPVAPFSGGEKARLVLALLVLQKPNLLLLDEPTNHLDLDMRHALGVALLEYSGALLVISHDRHLLRSVCDDLYVLHNGRLHEFRKPLDEYPNWLKDQDAAAVDEAVPGLQATRVSSKKQNRQEEARRRQLLKPYMDTVRKIDRQMIRHRADLAGLESVLHDESLYTDTARKEEMTLVLQQQAGLKSSLETLEWEWLEASEKLEEAGKNL
jgi:ATP-binding cassette subfamily F protein 3